jgi:hypothetical protein
MENEIDDDELAAMLAEDEQEKEEETTTANLSFAEQAETMTTEQLIEFTCSLIDEPSSATTKKNSTYTFSDAAAGELFENKTSKYESFFQYRQLEIYS